MCPVGDNPSCYLTHSDTLARTLGVGSGGFRGRDLGNVIESTVKGERDRK